MPKLDPAFAAIMYHDFFYHQVAGELSNDLARYMKHHQIPLGNETEASLTIEQVISLAEKDVPHCLDLIETRAGIETLDNLLEIFDSHLKHVEFLTISFAYGSFNSNLFEQLAKKLETLDSLKVFSLTWSSDSLTLEESDFIALVSGAARSGSLYRLEIKPLIDLSANIQQQILEIIQDNSTLAFVGKNIISLENMIDRILGKTIIIMSLILKLINSS